MEEKKQDKWYYKTYAVVVAILLLGPLALPLVWKNPRYNRTAKIAVTVVVAVMTYYLTLAFIKAIKSFNQSYQQILQMQ
jgi:lipopolysaccharide export LptBFGC system permease protein LptF